MSSKSTGQDDRVGIKGIYAENRKSERWTVVGRGGRHARIAGPKGSDNVIRRLLACNKHIINTEIN